MLRVARIVCLAWLALSSAGCVTMRLYENTIDAYPRTTTTESVSPRGVVEIAGLSVAADAQGAPRLHALMRLGNGGRQLYSATEDGHLVPVDGQELPARTTPVFASFEEHGRRVSAFLRLPPDGTIDRSARGGADWRSPDRDEARHGIFVAIEEPTNRSDVAATYRFRVFVPPASGRPCRRDPYASDGWTPELTPAGGVTPSDPLSYEGMPQGVTVKLESEPFLRRVVTTEDMPASAGVAFVLLAPFTVALDVALCPFEGAYALCLYALASSFRS